MLGQSKEVELKVDFSRGLVAISSLQPIDFADFVRESIESIVMQKGRERDKTKGIVWNLYRRAAPQTRQRASQSPKNQSGLTEKKTSTPGTRVLDGCRCPNQPPTAKNLIRCHNYKQWSSTTCRLRVSTLILLPERKSSLLINPDRA